jgi:DNA damage-binding protein 1
MLDKGFREKAFNVRLEPMLVRDITFVHPQLSVHGSASIVGPPTLAVLYEDEHSKGQPCLQFYELDAKEKVRYPHVVRFVILCTSWLQDVLQLLRAVGAKAISDLDVTSTLLTAIPEPSGGGVLVTGSVSVRHIPLPGPASLAPRTVDSAGIPSCIPKFISRVNPTTYIMADSMGALSMLLLKMDASSARPKIASISYTPLGSSVVASALAYLEAGILFVGSGCGDSQLVRLQAVPGSAPALDTLTVFPCLGPIVDLCVMDLERQGQGQVCARPFFGSRVVA